MAHPPEKSLVDLPIRKIDLEEINAILAFAKVWESLVEDAENQEERDYLERLARRARRKIEEAQQKGPGAQQQ